MKYYEFVQNNTGGSFDSNESVAHSVFIQADSPDSANTKAETIGIYFDGSGDCSCCGNRWCETSSYDGKDEPAMYVAGDQGGMTADLQAAVDADWFTSAGEVGAIVYHANGDIDRYRKAAHLQ